MASSDPGALAIWYKFLQSNVFAMGAKHPQSHTEHLQNFSNILCMILKNMLSMLRKCKCACWRHEQLSEIVWGSAFLVDNLIWRLSKRIHPNCASFKLGNT
eukprot:955589-Pelagomonas_calceolata.AAC.9